MKVFAWLTPWWLYTDVLMQALLGLHPILLIPKHTWFALCVCILKLNCDVAPWFYTLVLNPGFVSNLVRTMVCKHRGLVCTLVYTLVWFAPWFGLHTGLHPGLVFPPWFPPWFTPWFGFTPWFAPWFGFAP